MKFLTFDIEDWFHILDNPETKFPDQWEKFPRRVDIGLEKILHLCEVHNVKATFFCLGWIAEMYPDVIRKIHAAGHYLGTHGYSHQLVYEQTPYEFEADIRRSIALIESITGEDVKAYRAPGFSITKECLWAFDVLASCGIKYDSSVFPADRAHGGMKNLGHSEPFYLKTSGGQEILEFPVNVERAIGRPLVYSGGGYFRLMPTWVLLKLFSKSKYVMTYFHPRDFDPDQPSIPGLGAIRRFKCYYGLAGAEKKLHAILRNNEWVGSIDEFEVEPERHRIVIGDAFAS